jgi:biotin synthase
VSTALTETVAETGRASREELVQLLTCDDVLAAELYRAADEVRARIVGDEVHLRALVEFSNTCRRNCFYCGLRRDHDRLRRYRMTPEEIVATALEAARLGYRTAVLQSGEDPWYTSEMLAAVIREIKAKADIAVTLSIGERSLEEYRALREAGADRFLLRIETSSPLLYRDLHPDSDWAVRLGCLMSLRRLGYQLGSGVMIGLPGQTAEMMAEDLLFLQSLDLDMIGVGPFIPHPATPLADAAGGTLGPALRFVACLRLLCPEALIPATTALGALHPEGRQQALRAGANVLMPNCTPIEYREHYQLYPGKICISESAPECRSCVEAMVAALGRRVAADPGHSLRFRSMQAKRLHSQAEAAATTG